MGTMLIRFSNIFLRIIYYSSPLIQTKIKMNLNTWITPRKIILHDQKRELYNEAWNNSNNNTVASYYRGYFKIMFGY